MRKFLILVAGALLIVGSVAILSPHPPAQPRYQGRNLSSWLHLCRKHAADPADRKYTQATNAVHAIGTNALPCLLSWMDGRKLPPRFVYSLARISRWLPGSLNQKIFQWSTPVPDPKKAEDAVLAFRILGPEAAPAIPALLLFARSHKPGTTCALDALSAIGPPALGAVINLSTNSDSYMSFYAILALRHFGTNAAPAIPVLVSFLERGPPHDRAVAAAISLGTIGTGSEDALSALLRAAQGPQPLRDVAMRALADCATHGPGLEQLLETADQDLANRIRDLSRNSRRETTASPGP